MARVAACCHWHLFPFPHLEHSLHSIVLSLADGRPKVRYVLAVDDSHNTLKQIVKAVSSQLGNGKIQYISKEAALLNKDISVHEFECHLTLLYADLQDN